MLFDLQGKRRRVVQATYLTLAVLMGGGLVLFGVGSDATGGLADIFGGGNGGGSGNDVIQDRIDKNEGVAAKRGPKEDDALAELVRDHASLASAKLREGEGGIDEAREDFSAIAGYWERYEKIADPVDPAVANYAVQAYQVLGNSQQALDVAQEVAEKDNTANGYLTLMDIAAQAGNTRIRDLAAGKALDLAKKDERAAVKARIKAAKQAPAAGTTTGGG